MQVCHQSSAAKSTAPQDADPLLKSRMLVLGLDVDAIGRDYPEVFEKIRRNCPSCGDRESCALDLKREPSSSTWEAYCPNSDVLNAIVALTELKL